MKSATTFYADFISPLFLGISSCLCGIIEQKRFENMDILMKLVTFSRGDGN